MRHFITLNDVSVSELTQILELAEKIKAEVKSGVRTSYLANRTIAMIFEKQSLRTRVSFEAGMTQLGGSSMFLGADVGYGKRETTADFGRVLSSMVDAIVFRSKKHESIVELAEFCSCPVINALSDQAHPCQALADLLTMKEAFGTFAGLKLAWVGDSNNVAVSLVRICAKLGVKMSIASPKGYDFDSEKVKKIVGDAPTTGFEIELTTDPKKAVNGADAIYTDVWVSMGQEAEEAERKRIFAPYQVNEALMSAAKKTCIFLHCLPAKRGQEVTDAVMDSPQSRIVQQAENRMHAQKGLLVWLLNN
ncbi:MAG: ornithine carbamoyltransferase [Thermoguttaceae bacterium]